MKTIFKDGVYQRVDNEVGETKVKNSGWKYVSKQAWKTNVRDIKKKEEPVVSNEDIKEPQKTVKRYSKPKKS